jgi:transcription-repair coupling factor (superfamily II helicase)
LAIKEAVVLLVRELIINDQGSSGSVNDSRQPGNRGPQASHNANQRRPPAPGGEFLAPFFYDMDSLFRYVPENSLVALIEPDDIKKEIEEQHRKIQAGRAEELEEGRTLPEIAELYLDQESLRSGLSSFRALDIRLLGTGSGYRLDTKSAAWLSVRLTKPIDREHPADKAVEGTMAGLVEKLKRLREFNRVTIVCGTDDAAARLKKLFSEYELGMVLGPAAVSRDAGPWPVTLSVGRLSEGFAWQELGLTIITEEEIFGRKVHAGGRARPSKITPFLRPLRSWPGDFVFIRLRRRRVSGLTHMSIDGSRDRFSPSGMSRMRSSTFLSTASIKYRSISAPRD